LIGALRDRGYQVLGDLDELQPCPAVGPDGPRTAGSAQITEAEVAAAAIELATDLLFARRTGRRDPALGGVREERGQRRRGGRRGRPG
jgi:hypothetical protein